MYRSSFIPATTILSCAVLLLGACSDAAPTSPLSQPPSLSRGSFADRPAQLAICPTNRSYRARGVIGSKGGTLAAGGHRVTVPAGVITRPTVFTLNAPAGREVKLELRAGREEHYEFAAPVTVTISYERCERQHRAGLRASAWYVDDSGGDIELEHMGGTDDRERRAVTFTTMHFSTYVVAY